LSQERTKTRHYRELRTITPDQLDPAVVRRLPLEYLKKHGAIPVTLAEGETAIALADPLNTEVYDALVSILGRACPRVICPAAEIEQAISRCYYDAANSDSIHYSPDQPAVSGPDNANSLSAVQTQAEDLLNIADKAPAIKLANKILFQAVHSRASDIHIEPYEKEIKVRLRIDGVLHSILTLPKQHLAPLASRLKIMANLNIAEHRLPQDGQSRASIGEELVDIRVSVIPTACGERMVLRLLDRGRGELHLKDAGFDDETLEVFRQLTRVSHGIILLTGPTGSGKTTTLYGVLNELNSEERNILTVEDPIEYQLPGVGQMQVRPRIDLTFANCLRHILRQDPDIIMIGEIRDRETAEIAIQASLTGHLVLSTLHTNDAASAITRLVDMGIEPYLISATVVGVMAQRLLRVICPHCKETHDSKDWRLSRTEVQKLVSGHLQVYQGRGCDACLDTGYHGRTGIFELLLVDHDIKDLIIEQRGPYLIKQVAVQKGMTTLREDGLRKAFAGVTTLAEVYRVTQDSVRSEEEVRPHAAV
jgi:general secretion pathway protein E